MSCFSEILTLLQSEDETEHIMHLNRDAAQHCRAYREFQAFNVLAEFITNQHAFSRQIATAIGPLLASDEHLVADMV
jgi:hypothetical protein